MATAKLTTPVGTPPVTLELSGPEVEVLAALLGKIGGMGPARNRLDGILEALAETLGFDPEDGTTYPGLLTADALFTGAIRVV